MVDAIPRGREACLQFLRVHLQIQTLVGSLLSMMPAQLNQCLGELYAGVELDELRLCFLHRGNVCRQLDGIL